MPRLKFYIVTFLVLFTSTLLSQSVMEEDIDILQMNIQNFMTQSSFEMERGDYFNANENLYMNF